MAGFRAALALGWAAAAQLSAAPRQFAHPDRVRYDGECLTLDGEDVLVFSARFDYLECARPQWPERFRRIRAAGFNTVETAVPAGGLELGRLREWLRMAHDEFGFYSIVHPAPPALAAICQVLAPEQITRRALGSGGTILVQADQGPGLKPAYETMVAGGIETPIFISGAQPALASDDPELSQVVDQLGSAAESALQIVTALRNESSVVEYDGPAVPDASVLALGSLIRQFGPELARSHALTVQAQTGSADVALGARRARNGVTYVFLSNESAVVPRKGRAALWLNRDGIELGVDYDLPAQGANILRLEKGATGVPPAVTSGPKSR